MIQLENVTKVYRLGKVGVHALRGVTLSINKGEMIAVIGASGSGKSTLLNIIGLLDRPTSGSYLFDGVDVSRLSDNQLAEMRNKEFGFVFQDFNLLPRATALANVELPLVYAGSVHRRLERASEALEWVGLAERANHKPTELSGGEQQRGVEIISIFQKLHQEGKTVILITHEADIAAQAQRTVRLHDGRIAKSEV